MPYWLTRGFWLPNPLGEIKKQSTDNLGRIAQNSAFQAHRGPPIFKVHNAPRGNHMWKPDKANPQILVVEDDPDTRMALSEMLNDHGYPCVTAEHGGAAVEKILTLPIDVVITDYQMPVMDGLQLTEWLAMAYEENRPQVILVTGDINEDVQKRSKRVGVLTILPKPIERQDLFSALTKAIRR